MSEYDLIAAIGCIGPTRDLTFTHDDQVHGFRVDPVSARSRSSHTEQYRDGPTERQLNVEFGADVAFYTPTDRDVVDTGSMVLEAITCSCAVIVTDTLAIRDYIALGVEGLLTPIEDLLGDENERASRQAGPENGSDPLHDTDAWKRIRSVGVDRGLF